ncbi:Complement C5, partial [Ophiophagus hannah]
MGLKGNTFGSPVLLLHILRNKCPIRNEILAPGTNISIPDTLFCGCFELSSKERNGRMKISQLQGFFVKRYSTPPKFIRVGASEQVVIQTYGYTQEFSVTLSIKSYPDKITTYAFGTIQLTPANRFQGSVALTVQPKDLRTNDPQKRVESIYLEAASPHFTRQKKMLLTYDNGFLFIQTDKPIYTPDQSVKVRVYSLNEELKPARRATVLTFVDPDGVEVDIIHEEDATGIVSFPEFKIPPYPKFGIWTIKAKYDKEFTTSAVAKFHMEEGVGMLYFNSQIAIRELGYSELSDVDGATLYIAASVLETGDGHTEDAELTTVKYTLSPYKLDLIATPLFVKPGLPYFIKARVRDMLDVSVGDVPVVLQATALTDQLKETRLVEEGSDSGFGVTSWASDHRVLQVGETVQLEVYPASHYIEKILHYSYLILSKGKIIKYGTQEKIQGLSYQALTLHITEEMVPSARLLVYYIVTGEGTAELVADSVWLNIQQKCGNNLELRILNNGRVYQPGEAVSLSMTSKLDSLVALSAMDKAIYGVTGSKQKSMEKVMSGCQENIWRSSGILKCPTDFGSTFTQCREKAGIRTPFCSGEPKDRQRDPGVVCGGVIKS